MSFTTAIGSSLGSTLGSATGNALAPSLASIWGPTGQPSTPDARLSVALGRLPSVQKKRDEFPWLHLGIGFFATFAFATVVQLSEANKRKRQQSPLSSSQ